MIKKFLLILFIFVFQGIFVFCAIANDDTTAAALEKQPKEQPKEQPQEQQIQTKAQYPLNSQNIEEDKKFYEIKIQNAIKINWKPPIFSGSRHAIYKFRINKDGSFQNIELKTPSGSNAFDKSARKAIEKTSPFLSIPQSFNTDYVDMEMIFDKHAAYTMAETSSLKNNISSALLLSGKSYTENKEMEKALRWYTQNLKKQVEKKWLPPAVNKELCTQVNVVINKNGKIEGTEIFKSSGDKDFDESALTAVQEMTKYSMPQEFKNQKAAFQLTFSRSYKTYPIETPASYIIRSGINASTWLLWLLL